MICERCNTDGAERTLAAQTICDPCWYAFRESILERVILEADMTAALIRDGISRPDHGPGMAHCRCVSCEATLVAVPGEPCPYCDAAFERMRAWQAAKVLHPELPDPADVRHQAAISAWLERLATAVEAEIITQHQARAAWERRVLRVAA